MRFYEAVSERTKPNWEKLYQDIKDRKWENPTKDKREITCETELEDLEEIDRFIREVPNPTRRE